MTGKRRDVIFLGVALAVVVAIGVWFTVRDDSDGPSADPGPTPTMGTGTPQGSLATQPSTEPSSESSPSASLPSTPSTTPPPSSPSTAPTPMTERSREAAKQAGEDWFKALSWAFITGDTDPLRTMSSPSCKACGGLIQFVESHVDADSELHSKPFEIGRTAVNLYDSRSATLEIHVQWGQLIVRSKSTGKETFRNAPPKSAVATVEVTWIGERWQTVKMY